MAARDVVGFSTPSLCIFGQAFSMFGPPFRGMQQPVCYALYGKVAPIALMSG
jgi:hypothetical protein